MRKFMSIQSFRHPKLQNQSNGNDFTEVEEYCLPLYHFLYLNKYSTCNFISCIKLRKYTLMMCIDTLNGKIRLQELILEDIVEHYWPPFDIFVPRKNAMFVIFYAPASKIKIHFSCIDTFNSNIRLLVIILEQAI